MVSKQILKPDTGNQPFTRALLIFNPASGQPEESPLQLVEILTCLQDLNVHAEVFMVNPDCDLAQVTTDAVRRGIRMVIACGGDGTIDAVIGGLVGTRATLCIIPVGTQNNTARALGIPINDIRGAVDLIRNGQRARVDVGLASCGEKRRWFLETATVGLISALFPAADAIQHGDLARIGDFMATLVSSTPGQLHITIDNNRKRVETHGHIAIVTNMPYLGIQFQIAPNVAYDDGLFDLVVFSNFTKLDLIGVAMQVVGGIPQDPRIQYYRGREVSIQTDPAMPVMVDGFMLGEGDLKITMRRQAISILSSPPTVEKQMSAPVSAIESDTSG
ncbi:MAG: diacylglycerol/lipid kinase family protein [Omnitrophica WOR_2 bacterium]